MLNQLHTAQVDPADVFLDAKGLAARYGIGTTKATEMVRDGDLPASVVPGMVRVPLTALRAFDQATSLAGTVADLSLQRTSVTVVAPPPVGTTGRPARKAVV